MCNRLAVFQSLVCFAMLSGLAAEIPSAMAQSSTSRGQISVAQVRSMLNRADSNTMARQNLTAYLAGVGETVGILASSAAEKTTSLACARGFNLDSMSVRQALDSAPLDMPASSQTAATPLIVRDMLKRAGCNMTN